MSHTPLRVPLRNKMSALRSMAERFVRSANRILEERDTSFCDDEEFYRFSAFIANLSGSVEHVRDALEFWPEERE